MFAEVGVESIAIDVDVSVHRVRVPVGKLAGDTQIPESRQAGEIAPVGLDPDR
jgi:hypothetical protein